MITVTKSHHFESYKYPSNHLKIDNNEFIVGGVECFVTDLEDYTILSDFDITDYLKTEPDGRKPNCRILGSDSLRCIPIEIRSKHDDRWINVAHIQSSSRPIITRDRLRDRVYGGQILAYHIKECSIEGNRCIYYGFLPTLNFKSLQTNKRFKESLWNDCMNSDYSVCGAEADNNNTDDENDRAPLSDVSEKNGNIQSFYGAHVTTKINVQHVWSRKLYIQLKRDSACSCSVGCLRVSVLTVNDVSATVTDDRKIIRPKRTYCLKRVPWNSVYIMMGDINKNVIEGLKEHRLCKICAQCRKCLNSTVFCRDHKRCKHEKTLVDTSSFDLSLGMPKIKKCRKII